jgi:hypothetical protein
VSCNVNIVVCLVGEYLQKRSVTLAMFGRCEQSGYNLATIRPTIQLIIAIKQGLIIITCDKDFRKGCNRPSHTISWVTPVNSTEWVANEFTTQITQPQIAATKFYLCLSTWPTPTSLWHINPSLVVVPLIGKSFRSIDPISSLLWTTGYCWVMWAPHGMDTYRWEWLDDALETGYTFIVCNWYPRHTRIEGGCTGRRPVIRVLPSRIRRTTIVRFRCLSPRVDLRRAERCGFCPFISPNNVEPWS